MVGFVHTDEKGNLKGEVQPNINPRTAPITAGSFNKSGYVLAYALSYDWGSACSLSLSFGLADASAKARTSRQQSWYADHCVAARAEGRRAAKEEEDSVKQQHVEVTSNVQFHSSTFHLAL